MSYCRFENTFGDLSECVGALEEREELSNSEQIYAKLMREMCEEYINAYDEIY